jgi:hypothetical protein
MTVASVLGKLVLFLILAASTAAEFACVYSNATQGAACSVDGVAHVSLGNLSAASALTVTGSTSTSTLLVVATGMT